jgi:hypothetical protein
MADTNAGAPSEKGAEDHGMDPAICRLVASRRTIGRLISIWSAEADDMSAAGVQHMISRLERACRRDRQLGLRGHWAYDIARHAQMCEALKIEQQALAVLERSECRG